MKAKTLVLAALSMFTVLVPYYSRAATVPAGATVIVQTLHAVSSVDAPGTRFETRLVNNVIVNGKVILHAGTKLSGKVETSRRTVSSSQRLTVDLTDVQIGDRAVPIKTTGASQLSNDFRTRHGIEVSRASYTVAAGKRIEFRLAQPLNL